MTDVKITEYTELTAPAAGDVLEIVDDPSGSPISKKVTVKSLLEAFDNYSIVGTDFSLSAASGVQSAFPTTGDVFTLEASTTYEFEGTYYIDKSGTTCTTALAFLLAGGASITSIAYQAIAQNVAVNTTGATHGSAWINQVASTVVNVTASTAVYINFKGIIRMNAAGTVTPQINFSAAPTTPVMKPMSYIKFTKIGTTNNILGGVA